MIRMTEISPDPSCIAREHPLLILKDKSCTSYMCRTSSSGFVFFIGGLWREEAGPELGNKATCIAYNKRSAHADTHGFTSFRLIILLTSANFRVFFAFPMTLCVFFCRPVRAAQPDRLQESLAGSLSGQYEARCYLSRM